MSAQDEIIDNDTIELEAHTVSAKPKNCDGDRATNVSPEQERAPPNLDPDPFIWLGQWLVYFPMVVQYRLHNGKVTKCNPICTRIFYIYAFLLSIGGFLWYSIPPFIENGFALYPVVYFIAMFLQTISKFVSIHYFWTYFKFDTLRTVSLVNTNNKVHIDTSSTVQKVNRRFKITLFIFIVFTVALVITKIVRITTDDEAVTMDWLYCGRTIIYYYTFDIPYLLTQFVLSIYYCKGHVFIQDLDQRLNDDPDKVGFGTVFDEYRAFRRDFQEQIWYLELMLKCRLAALIAWIWIDITELANSENGWYGMRNFLYIALGCIPPIELVFSGSPATTTYHSFKERVHDFKELSLKRCNFMAYMTEYPFLITIFAREISIKNALKVAAAFAGAKVLSYLFRQHEL
eukprot:275144_1